MTASASPSSSASSSASSRSRTAGSSSAAEARWRPGAAARRGRRSGSPACSVMTWPSSAPSSRTSTRERVAGPRRADPAGSAAGADRVDAGRGHDGPSRRRPVPQPSRDRVATFRGCDRSYPCMVMSVAPQRDERRMRRTGRPAPVRGRSADRRAPDQLDQLRFIHDVARLATTARTWDELLGDGRRRDAGRAPCRCLLALPARPRRSVPDARRDERPRPLPDRSRPGPVRRGRDGLGRRQPATAGDPRRQGGPALPVGPRHRPAAVRRPRC